MRQAQTQGLHGESAASEIQELTLPFLISGFGFATLSKLSAYGVRADDEEVIPGLAKEGRCT